MWKLLAAAPRCGALAVAVPLAAAAAAAAPPQRRPPVAAEAPKEKPSLPEGYKVPPVWAPKAMGGTFGAINRPTAGPRSDAELKKGQHAIQLHSLGTPNGQKVTILLEELGVEYDAYNISIMKMDQFSKGFVALNPNSKIPAMYDWNPDDSSANAKVSPRGQPIRVFESGSILIYLAEKYGKFIPKDPRKKTECISWLMWQMGSAPVIGGGFGHFYKYAPVSIEYAIDRFSMETKRLLDVLEQHLAGTSDGVKKEYICGDEYTIADMAIMPWVMCITSEQGYNASKFLDTESYKHLNLWVQRLKARKAVQRGMRVNREWDATGLAERHSKADFKPEDY